MYIIKFNIDMVKSMILCFILVMTILNILKEVYRIYLAVKSEEKYESGNLRTILTFSSLAYIITIIFFGL